MVSRVIALTTGEPAGIGPDLCVSLTERDCDAPVVLIGDAGLLHARAGLLGLRATWPAYSAEAPARVSVLHVPLAVPCVPGRLDRANAGYVLRLLDLALEGALNGAFGAIVTAPVHKGVINDAGVAFSGHTEYLAERSGGGPVVMMLVGGGLRVALATTHLPLAAVPGAIERNALLETLHVIERDLRLRFGIARPRIAVAGLNPHSGEGGHLGREEIDVIGPAIEAARAQGIAAEGPIPADTLFVPHRLEHIDCALAMYHDQGLAVLKYASFGRGVNVTLGLPFVRTSVDHGTALDLAGRGGADSGSLCEALRLAVALATRGRARH